MFRYNGKRILDLLMQDRYFDTQFTRFYMDYADRTVSNDLVTAIQRIWDGRDAYIIEGETTRFGEGNDFLGDARSILPYPLSTQRCF